VEQKKATGITRREFLTWAGVAAASLGLSSLGVTKIAEALEAGLAMHPVIWLQGGGCTGCSISFINTVNPDIKTVLLDPVVPGHQLSVKFHPTVMAAAGDLAISAIEKTRDAFKGQFILVIEGSVLTGDDGAYCDIGERNGKPIAMVDWTKDLCSNAMAVLSIGTCASYGGIPSAKPNPTGSKSVADVMKAAGIRTPVLNMPGCPPNPDWFVLAVAQILLNGLPKADELDEYGRLKKFHGVSVHDQCPRLKFFEAGTFAEKFGDEGCLVQLGCKGPMSMADCPTRKWNNGVNFCIGAGAPCLACCEPGFPELSEPFYGMMSEETMIRVGLKIRKQEDITNA
jgi:hydrogenase small subunit